MKHRWMVAALAVLVSSLAIVVQARPYKGAEIYTYNGNTYGKYVMRMKVAKGSGVLSTFFLYKAGSQEPGAFWEEIDIEIFGQQNAIYWESNIIYGSPKKETYLRHTASQSLADAYNTYTLEWTPTYVAWFVNGQQIRRINGGAAVTSLTSPQTMRFNLWSAFAESWVGPFDPNILPVHQFINWVEYHRYNPATGSFTLEWRDDFTTFDSGRWGKAAWTFDDNRVDFVPENAVVKDGVMVLALTREGATGFTGSVPVDGAVNSSSSSSVSSSSSSSVRSSASSVRSSSSSASAGFTRLIQAESYSIMSGVQTETTSDTGNGRNVGWIDANDWMAYDNITIPTAGRYRVEYRVASINGSLLSLDLNAGDIQLGEVRVPATGGWQAWQTVSHTVQLPAGTFSVGIYAQQGGWNINWFRITRI